MIVDIIEALPASIPAPIGSFTIRVVGVRGIKDSDWLQGSGKPDFVVVITHEGNPIGSTDVIANSPQPVEPEDFDVTIYNEGDELQFLVYDRDETGSECLGSIAMKPEQFAADGFNDEVLLEDTGVDIEGYLSFKIRPQGKQYPAGPPSTFTVEVEKGQNTEYGLVIENLHDTHMIVCEIEAGAFADYNKSVKPSQQLKKSDFIVSVNDRIRIADCVEQFQESKVTCVVKRGVEFSYILQREDLHKPLGLWFPVEVKLQGNGFPITDVSVIEGAAHEESSCAGEWDIVEVKDGDRGSAHACLDSTLSQHARPWINKGVLALFFAQCGVNPSIVDAESAHAIVSSV